MLAISTLFEKKPYILAAHQEELTFKKLRLIYTAELLTSQ